MKVLLLSTSDIEGGAARSAYRLHQGFKQCGVATQMLVQVKSSDDPTVLDPPPNFRRDFAKSRPSFDFLPLKFYPHKQGTPFSCQWLPDGLPKRVKALSPDVINLHWIGSGYVQIETLAKLLPPIVLTLHDMWAFTGGCHYSQECDRYTQSCGACPQLGSTHNWDLSRWIWQRKAQSWRHLNLTIITPSQWLASCVRASSLFGEQPLEVIPYGIDTDLYRPCDRRTARNLLNLPQDQPLILAGAVNFSGDRRKGFHLLKTALQHLKQLSGHEQTELLVYGASPPQEGSAPDLGMPIHYLGTLKDDLSLVLAYSAADVFVAPSLQDNLPNTVLEALACGTPCVAFKIGGMPDLIHHEQTGYLAQPFDPVDLAQGIHWILESPDRQRTLAIAARHYAETTFPLTLQAQRYLALFQALHERSTTPQSL
ncbi:glycosyltransferase family 4 protein [Pantanalinema sp. GBBB05]|uniref:glycosyltransferase family 4 protein n=1 Tax=Pantanalinema sp. GBBB05 TaxID=2604139 RepID=UPI001DD25449|nr:glycosyltransferase [Pantanalinema sp. GBBB05]